MNKTLQPRIAEFTISMKSKVKSSDLYSIKSSEDIANVCRECFNADTIDWVESFIVIAMSMAGKAIGFYKVSQGGITGTVADPRVIFQFAMLSNASSIILCHNHPTGNLRPSAADINLTNKLKSAGKMLDIAVLDHVIITSEGHYSLFENGDV